MYEFDFISVVVGYIAGVFLAYHTTRLFFAEEDND